MTENEMTATRNVLFAAGLTTEGREHREYETDANGEYVQVEVDGEMEFVEHKSYSVLASLSDSRSGNTVVREFSEAVTAEEATKGAAEMQKELATRAKATRKQLAAEKSLDAE